MNRLTKLKWTEVKKMAEKYVKLSDIKKKLNYICRKYGVVPCVKQEISDALAKIPYTVKEELEATLEVEDAPAVNVVSVRCKDCRFYVEYDEGGHYCEMLDCDTPGEDFYCREAVKKGRDF